MVPLVEIGPPLALRPPACLAASGSCGAGVEVCAVVAGWAEGDEVGVVVEEGVVLVVGGGDVVDAWAAGAAAVSAGAVVAGEDGCACALPGGGVAWVSWASGHKKTRSVAGMW